MCALTPRERGSSASARHALVSRVHSTTSNCTWMPTSRRVCWIASFMVSGCIVPDPCARILTRVTRGKRGNAGFSASWRRASFHSSRLGSRMARSRTLQAVSRNGPVPEGALRKASQDRPTRSHCAGRDITIQAMP